MKPNFTLRIIKLVKGDLSVLNDKKHIRMKERKVGARDDLLILHLPNSYNHHFYRDCTFLNSKMTNIFSMVFGLCRKEERKVFSSKESTSKRWWFL